MNKKTLISSSNISKSFGKVEALKNFSLTVGRGEIAGVVGPDGAGKTTAMRILSTVSLPDNGILEISGKNALKYYRLVRHSIGYMSQKFGLYTDMSVEENIYFFAEIQNVPKKYIKDRCKILLEASGMYQFKDRLAGKLSGGMKQKLSLSCALIHEPEVLILDEPTNGVDPVSRREFWQILNKFVSDGTGVVYATSYLDEAERCNKIHLMNNGEVIAFGKLDELKSDFKPKIIEIKGDHVREIVGELSGRYGKVWSFGSSLHIHTFESVDILNILKDKYGSRFQISFVEPNLEDIFTFLTGSSNE